MKCCTPASSHIPTSAAYVLPTFFTCHPFFPEAILFTVCMGKYYDGHFEWPKWQPYVNIEFQIPGAVSFS